MYRSHALRGIPVRAPQPKARVLVPNRPERCATSRGPLVESEACPDWTLKAATTRSPAAHASTGSVRRAPAPMPHVAPVSNHADAPRAAGNRSRFSQSRVLAFPAKYRRPAEPGIGSAGGAPPVSRIVVFDWPGRPLVRICIQALGRTLGGDRLLLWRAVDLPTGKAIAARLFLATAQFGRCLEQIEQCLVQQDAKSAVWPTQPVRRIGGSEAALNGGRS